MDVTRGRRSDGTQFTRIVMEIDDLAQEDFLCWQRRLRSSTNELIASATRAQLIALDTRGEPLISEGVRWTSKGQVTREIETLAGVITVARHVYQTSAGGRTRAPLDERAGLIGSACPEMAQVISAKSAEMSSRSVERDLKISHLRTISSTFAQDLATEVSRLASQADAHMPWTPLTKASDVSLICVGLDSAMLNARTAGWRAAHCATIALYNHEGRRIETIFVASGPGETPPEGKKAFFTLAQRWLDKVKAAYPKAATHGLSDAASDILEWLSLNTTTQGIDYHHVCEYVSAAAPALLNATWARESRQEAKILASTMRRILRDEPNGAEELHALMTDHLETHGQSLPPEQRESLADAVRYLGNHKHLMKYAPWRAAKIPIGSGVTEAACKVIIKQRLTQSGMRWLCQSADELLRLRSLYRTPTRWEAFWAHHLHKSQTQGLAPLRKMKPCQSP